MKKIIIGLMLLATIAATGCAGTAYEVYSSATNRTEGVMYGKSKTNISVEIDFNLNGASIKDRKDMELWKKSTYEAVTTFNKETNQEAIELYVNAYNLGFQAKLYVDQDQTLIVSPLFPKIILINGWDELSISTTETTGQSGFELSQKSLKEIQSLWTALMMSEDRTEIGNIIISTPEGEIKTKEFIMNLKDEELKPVMKETMEIFIQDEAIMNLIRENSDLHLLTLNDIDKYLEKVKVEKFSHNAFIDRDGFIAEEKLRIELDFSGFESILVNKVYVDINIQNWDLEKSVEIVIPQLSEDNIMRLDEIFEMKILNTVQKGGAL